MLKCPCLLLICQAILQPFADAQNLLPNSGFESHGPLKCIICPMLPGTFSSILPAWQKLSGSAPVICDEQYKEDRVAKEMGNCPFVKVKPYAGHTMMELNYRPSCHDWDFKTRGCSDYLGTQLGSPLDIGKIYEISFWIYIFPSKDSSYAQQIGCNLYPDIVNNSRNELLHGSKFLLDTILYGRWYQAKWLVRPVCNLNFLVIGVFRGADGPPINSDGHDNRFYIDEVAVKPVESSTTDSSTPIVPYCRYNAPTKENLRPQIGNTTCFFVSSDSSLSTVAQLSLDSFAIRAKKNPSIAFLVSGHTDEVGSNHTALSKARVTSVVNYLEKKHGIPAFRLVQLYRGTADPAAANDTESSRAKNRRVDISQTESNMADVVYRNLLLEVFDGNKEEAFRLLDIWLQIAHVDSKIHLLFDPRLAMLQADKRWPALAIRKVKNTYRTYQKPKLAYALDSLGREDQKCRTLQYYVENLHTYFAEIDSFDQRFDVRYFPDTADYLCAARNREHLQALKNLIGDRSWPKISEVGERATKSAFLIISHTGDSADIIHYLPFLQQRCTEGEAEWIHYAMLYDRLQVWRNLPQRFGTQYKTSRNPGAAPTLLPLEDAGKVNHWRTALGIEPLLEVDDGH